VALLFPSLYEGFGLPPLEAMACGAPVIATERPAMDDVLRGAACFVPPREPHAIANIVQELLQSDGEREQVASKGREHVAHYSWEKTAAETLEVYREVARR
jgi:glycosyltransferase involved in cell wall biosynthesis